MNTSQPRPNRRQAKASDEPHWPGAGLRASAAARPPARSRRPAGRRCSACASRPARRPRTCSRCAPASRARPRGAGRGTAASGATAGRRRGPASGISTSGSAETSCSMSAIGKIGVRSGGPAGSIVPGCSGGSGSPGRSGSRLTQCVGIRSSVSRNFVGARRAHGADPNPGGGRSRRRRAGSGRSSCTPAVAVEAGEVDGAAARAHLDDHAPRRAGGHGPRRRASGSRRRAIVRACSEVSSIAMGASVGAHG